MQEQTKSHTSATMIHKLQVYTHISGPWSSDPRLACGSAGAPSTWPSAAETTPAPAGSQPRPCCVIIIILLEFSSNNTNK